MEEQTFYINNTPVAKRIRNGITSGSYSVITEYSHRTETKFSIYEKDDSDNDFERLSYVDMMICDAVYTLYLTNQPFISPGIILRILSGDSKQTCRPETVKRINDSLVKMSQLEFTLDCDDELKRRKIKDPILEETEKTDFIELKKYSDKGNDYQYSNTKPYLYHYAERLKQLVPVPWDIWSLYGTKPFRNSLDFIVLKHYLIHRILVANYNSQKKNLQNMNTIYYYHRSKNQNDNPYTGMLFDLDLVAWSDPDNPEDEKRNLGRIEFESNLRQILSKCKIPVHKNTKIILDVLKSHEFIHDYKEIKSNGKEVIGVQIIKTDPAEDSQENLEQETE